jgi:SAM-dependent methyltransferase
LARRGYAVTGVDRTTILLDKARSHAADAGVEVEFVQCDMRDFVRPNTFSLVLSMFTSFGYFDDKSEDAGVLRQVRESLVVGGKLVIDVTGKERLAKVFTPTSSVSLEDGSLHVARHEIIDDWTRIKNEWLVIRDGKAKSFRFHHTVYSGEELRALLMRAGFGKVRLYGDFDGSEYGVNARRLIAVATK